MVDLSKLPDQTEPEEKAVDMSGLPDQEPAPIMPIDEQEERAGLYKAMMDEAWGVGQETGSIWPLAEVAGAIYEDTAWAFWSGTGSTILSGILGIMSMPANFFFEDASTKVVETVHDWLMVEPRTETSKAFFQSQMYPLEKLNEAGGKVGNIVLERTNSPLLAAGAHAIIAGAPAFLGLRGPVKGAVGKVRSSVLYRRMTIRQRGVAIKRLHEFARDNPKATEAQLIKHAESIGIEALKEQKIQEVRGVRGKPPTPEQAAKATAEKAIDLETSIQAMQKNAQRPIIQGAIAENIPVYRETLLPFKGEAWADAVLNDPKKLRLEIPTDEEIDIWMDIQAGEVVGGVPEVEGVKYIQTAEDLRDQGYTPEQAEYLLRYQADRIAGLSDMGSLTKADLASIGSEMDRLEGSQEITVFRAVPKGKGINEGDFVFLDKQSVDSFVEEYGKVRGQPEIVSMRVKKSDLLIPDKETPGEAIFAPEKVSAFQDMEGIDPSEIIPMAEQPVDFDFKGHVSSYVTEFIDLVKTGEPGKRLQVGEGLEKTFIGFKSSYPEWMLGQGWTAEQVITALEKGLRGEKLGKNQEFIFLRALEEAQEMFIQDIEKYMPEALDKAEATIDAAITEMLLGKTERLEKVSTERRERMKATREHLKAVRRGLKPKKVKGVKKTVRETTGQVTLSNMVREDVALKAAMKKASQAARVAFAAGKKEAVAKERMRLRLLKAEAKIRADQRKEFQKMVLKLRKVNPAEMDPVQAAPVRELLEGLDLVRLNKKKKLSLQAMKKHLEEHPDSEMTDRMAAGLDRLEKVNLNDITFDELKDIFDSVMHHVKLSKKKQEIKVKRRDMDAEKTLALSIREMRPPPEIKGDIIDLMPEKGRTTVARYIKEGLYIRQLHYDLLVELLAGTRSVMFDVLYRQPKAGTQVELKYKQDAFNTFQKGIEDSGLFGKGKKIPDVDKWLNEPVRVGPYQYPRNTLLALYRHSLNADNFNALLKGGFGRKFSKNPNEVFKLDAEDLNRALDNMTPEELAFAGDHVTEIFENQWFGMNEVFLLVNGFELSKTSGLYYPKEVMPGKRGTDFEKEEALEMLKSQKMRIGISKGMTKERIGSVKPIYLNDLTYDVNKSVTKAAAYIGLEIPLRNATRLLYDKQGRFRQEIEKRYGTETFREIEKALRDVAGDWQSYTSVEKIAMNLKNRIAPAMLGLNPFVMAIQPLSLPLASVFVKSDYLMRGMINYTMDPKGATARHDMNSPEWVERMKGGFSRDISDVAKAASERRIFGGKKPWSERMMSGIQRGDKIAVAPIMEGAVLQALDEFAAGKLSKEVKEALDMDNADIAGLNPVEKMQKAYEFADWVIQRTQPMFTKMQQSSFQRGVALEKLMTMFGSFTNQAFNLLVRTYMEQKTAGVRLDYIKDQAREEANRSAEWGRKMDEAMKAKSASDAKFAKALVAVMVLNTLGIVAKEKGRDWLLDREGSSFLATVLKSYAGLLFGVRDVAAPIIDGLLSDKPRFGQDVSLPIQRPIELMVKIPLDMGKIVSGKNAKVREKAAGRFVNNSLELLLMRYGLPYRSPKQIVEITGGLIK